MPQKVDTTEQQVPSSFTWRIFRIMSEFVEGFQFLVGLKRTVTFFGSSRVKPGSVYYKKAEDLASRLSKAKFTVITGGGPGIMEAVNKGATLAGGESIGLNIQLPFEQRMNTYVKRGIGFHYFFTRKVILSFSAQAYVYFPGGFGTLDEFFEIITLIQTQKMDRIPVILIGSEYWQPLIAWLESTVLVKQRAIEEDDLELFQVTDSVDEAFRIIKKSKERPRVFTE
ncbi:MAG: Lysine decarboxylase family [Parcubacteria group bacterium GW2011_GWA2_43_13]|nr:MAG: Lysine decarboxylase family [Parcubacteria group bacterium GW2011_GWA2_43_13]OGY68907.1 MAG: Rossman fold protein, TIGR00730 family [Candidatus Jacksonbacteria bacterium RIFCSPHIGHO2_02_FULL_43_10]OGY70439.1 MAG: Rossman fold protein, TIGR00730 family [Candidatus Jacksonbacteria bacterium RIFCSPLOWO2_01_FULL_44_13]HAZ16992.1 TIGR00730 family Rossman fold protein [Candidatus Jacksonbacteria bacterium]